MDDFPKNYEDEQNGQTDSIASPEATMRMVKTRKKTKTENSSEEADTQRGRQGMSKICLMSLWASIKTSKKGGQSIWASPLRIVENQSFKWKKL